MLKRMYSYILTRSCCRKLKDVDARSYMDGDYYNTYVFMYLCRDNYAILCGTSRVMSELMGMKSYRKIGKYITYI